MGIRLANLKGRASLLVGDRALDLERRSRGHFSADPMQAISRFDELAEWADGIDVEDAGETLDVDALGPCVPCPQKVFGIGLNYRDHAKEAGLELPEQPMVFTKFPSCLVGPRSEVVLTSNRVDWEVELVAVIGRAGTGIPEADAGRFIAGYCIGQDISDRRMQFADRPPQFSLGKSADTFGPIGPAVVSLDSFEDPNDLTLSCDVNGERMQDGRTRDMIFAVPELVAYLSRHCTLLPGDLIFTGTPAGVGFARERYLRQDDEITSTIEPIGSLVNRCVGA